MNHLDDGVFVDKVHVGDVATPGHVGSHAVKMSRLSRE